MPNPSYLRPWLGALALSVWCVVALAQPAANGTSTDTAPRADEAPVPEDPFGRVTPAGSIGGFIKALGEQDYLRASRYLDLSDVAPSRRGTAGPELARDLQRALDQSGRIWPRAQLSEEPAGNLADQLEPDLERVGTLGDGKAATDLLLRRVEEEGTPLWLVAEETLDDLSALRADGTRAIAERWLPTAFTETAFMGAPVSHWLTLAGMVLAAFAISWLVVRALLWALRRVGWTYSRLHYYLKAGGPPLELLLALVIAASAAPGLGIAIVARQTYGRLAEIVGWFALGWLLWRLIDALNDRLLERFGHRGQATAASIVRFAGRLAKMAVIAVSVIAILDAFGFDITAAVAALGIGGLALALGAQKTVENLIASLSIISDRPFRVGDFCKIGDTMGTVEDIGMRSTRIRTLDRTLVTIPNNNLVSSEVENFAFRDRFWFKPMLHLATGTPPDKVRALLESLRTRLAGDARLLGQSVRVHLLLPTSDRLPIEVFGYVLAADFDEFLVIQEELTLKLLDLVAEHGLILAPPTVDLRRTEAPVLRGGQARP